MVGQEIRKEKDLLDNFNELPESLQDKLLNGVKCLAFLHDLADAKDDDGERYDKSVQAATA